MMKKILFVMMLCWNLPSIAQDTTVFVCQQVFVDSSEEVESQDKVMVINKAGKLTTLKAFLKAIEADIIVQTGIIDLDNDGKKELLIFNFTGGAHCCDEVFFMKNIGPNKYQYAAKTFGGDLCVTGKNEFTYSFYQNLGYFFTCFACGLQDTTDAAPIPLASIRLKYEKGKLVVLPGDNELRSLVNDNLAKLGERPYQPLTDEIDQDDGWRKAIAMNLAVFYYSFGKNLMLTKQLFVKYYRHPDATKVWNEFSRTLDYMKKDNSF